MYQNVAKSGFQYGTRVSYGVHVVDEDKKRRMMAPLRVEKKKVLKSVISNWRNLTPDQANRRLKRLMSEVRVRHMNVCKQGKQLKLKPSVVPVVASIPANEDINLRIDDGKVYTSSLQGLKMTIRLVDAKENSYQLSSKRKRDDVEDELHLLCKQKKHKIIEEHKRCTIYASSPLNTPLPKKLTVTRHY